MELSNWPFTRDQVKVAIGLKASDAQPPDADLDLWAAFVTELVDTRTGRDEAPSRHVITTTTEDGEQHALPVAFVMAARVSARLLWRQEKNGSDRTQNGSPEVPAGADMPSKAKAWLANYPPSPGIA